jgi:hypothetical protein
MAKNAFIDPTSKVLVGWGFTSANRPGDVAIPVPDDFALALGVWQWNGQAFVSYTPAAVPDGAAFELALHSVFPDDTFFSFVTSFGVLSMLFLDAIRRGTWPLVQALILQAKSQNVIDDSHYAAIKAAATAANLPVTL